MAQAKVHSTYSVTFDPDLSGPAVKPQAKYLSATADSAPRLPMA